jgi:cyclophilin family peptidyl-prolyl cis-trans isomerase
MKICLVSILGLALFLPAAGQTVRFHTNLGDIDVNLLPDSAPLTVENFLKYTDRGSYNNSFFHRSVRGFIIQGGGYKVQSSGVTEIPSDPPVKNEFKVSNTRGTLAMAKLGDNPNSATNQWFFNLANNASNLNNQNGGFTVFGRVANDEGLAVMDKIAALTVVNAGSPFDQLPVVNYVGGQLQISNFVVVSSITRLEDPVQTMKIDGIVTASNFGGCARIVHRNLRIELRRAGERVDRERLHRRQGSFVSR